MTNPIVNNRLVCDMTFAVRFLHFAKGVEAHDFMGEEEKDSMICYASRLLRRQSETVTDQCEIDYLKRIGVPICNPMRIIEELSDDEQDKYWNGDENTQAKVKSVLNYRKKMMKEYLGER